MRSAWTSVAVIGVVASGVLVAGGCESSAFVCQSDEACRDGDLIGVCEPVGSCSFPDDACASGRRYGVHGAPAIAGECVPTGGTESGTEVGTTASTTASTDPTSDSDVTSPTSSVSAGSSTGTAESSGGAETGSTTTAEPCPADWLDCASSHRLRLIAAAAGQIGVPVPVRLTPDRFDYASAAVDGADLRVLDEVGEPLPFEIELWNPRGTSIVWVRVDLDRDIEVSVSLYWGGVGPAEPPTSALVWVDHAAVFHLDPSGVDASGNTAAGVASGTTTTGEGWLGSGQVFVDVESRFDVAPVDAIADLCLTGCTISAWVHAQSWGGTGRGRIADKSDGGAGGWMFYASGDEGGDLRFRYGYPSGQVIWTTPPETMALSTWHHTAATFDASTGDPPRLYIDGVEHEVTADMPLVSAPLPDADNSILVGNSLINNRWFDGTIDELRVEPQVRTPEWLALQHTAMTDALFEYRAVETLP